jgi:hypothetical protein
MTQLQSQELGELATAWAKAQAEMPVITLDKQVSYKNINFEYASLSNIIHATKPILAKHGLSILQFPSSNGETVTVGTRILHISGQFIDSEVTATLANPKDPKELGSMVSYLRRYSYGSICAIALDGDYDATTIAEKYLGTSEQKVWLRDLLLSRGLDQAAMRAVSDEMIRGNYEATEEAAYKAMEVLRK